MRALVLCLLLVSLAACGSEPAAPEPAATAESAVSAPRPAASPVGRDSLGAEPLAADARWTAGVVDLGGSDVQAELVAVRTARHDGFDRTVFEFSGGVPATHIEYVDRPVRACGSGRVVELPGDGWLQVRFFGARAHTEAGEATVADRDRRLSLPALLALALTCDFEGEVTWVAGVAAPNPYRAFTLDAPARLVVDVRRR